MLSRKELLLLTIAGAVGLLSASLAWFTPAANAQDDQVPGDVLHVLRSYEQAWAARDAQALANLFAEDGLVLSDGKPPVRGREAIRKHYEGAGGSLHLSVIAWAQEGAIGFVIGEYADAPGVPPTGKFTLTLKRDERDAARWLIASDMDNANQRRSQEISRNRLVEITKQAVESLSNPTSYLSCRDTIKHGVLPRKQVKPADAELIHSRREEIKPELLKALERDEYGAALLLGFVHGKEALPMLRSKLLDDRSFHGWDGPDYSVEESYLRDDQYPRQMSYIVAWEAITQLPLHRGMRLTPEERASLERDAAEAAPSGVEVGGRYAAKWLLQKLDQPQR